MFLRLLLVVMIAADVTVAHDLWLLPPADTSAGKPTPLIVRANSGDVFPKSEHAPDPAVFLKRLVVSPNGAVGEAEAAGTEGTSGLLKLTPEKPGLYIVAVETKPKLITLEADKFNAYLVSDGLAHIYQMRAKEKTLDQPGKERYSKFPKVLIRVGDGGLTDATRPVGLTLEIIPRKDPFALKVGDTLPVRVLFRGEPLAGANLGWAHPEGDSPIGTVRTNAQGEALIPIAKTGLMTIRLTHMTRPKTSEYEWESFWTTLTWTIPG
jgi:hypothetical protein